MDISDFYSITVTFLEEDTITNLSFRFFLFILMIKIDIL